MQVATNQREYEKTSLNDPLMQSQQLEEKYPTFCYIKLRKGVSRLNFIGFLTLHIPALFLLEGCSLLFTLLIEDPRYIDIPPTETGNFIANSTVASSIVSLIFAQLAGMLYDILGRRVLITGSCAFGAIILALIPYCSNLTLLFIAKILVMNCGLVVMLAPLLIDYIHQDSKGLATGISSVIAGITKILLLAVELPLTTQIPIYANFQLNGGIAFLLSIFLFFSVSDVYYREEKQHLPCGKNVQQKFVILLRQCRKKEILLSLFGIFTISALPIYYGSFVFQGQPKLNRELINEVMGISSYISLLLSLPIGWLADRIQYQKLSLLLFAVVGAMFFCLYFMSCMDCISARILLIAIFSFALPLTVLNILSLARSVEGNARGTVMGVFGVSSQLSIILFSLLNGFLLSEVELSKFFFLSNGSIQAVMTFLTVLFIISK